MIYFLDIKVNNEGCCYRFVGFVGKRPQTLPHKQKVCVAAPLAVVYHHFIAGRAVITTKAAVVKSVKATSTTSPNKKKKKTLRTLLNLLSNSHEQLFFIGTTPIYPPIHSRCSPVSTHPFPTFYLCHLLLMLPSGIHQRVGYLIVQTQARQLSLAMTLLGHRGGRGGGALRFPFDIIRYLLGTASPEGHHNAIPFLYVRPYNSFQYFILHSPSIISSNTEKSGEPTKCVVLYFFPPAH